MLHKALLAGLAAFVIRIVNGRSVVPKSASQGNNASKPSQRHSGPPEEADTGAIHVTELPGTPPMSVEKLRDRSGGWSFWRPGRLPPG